MSPPPVGGTSYTISGTATYDFVPTKADGRGLNYAGTTQKPIRGANAELLSASGAVLATATTNELGAYSFTLATAQPVTVRIRAEIKRTGSANGDRDFTVRDNTSGNALYVLDSAAFTPSTAATTQNLNAASGWTGSAYATTRPAAPFAILDVVYAAQAKVATVAPTVTLPPLTLYWSPSNEPTTNPDGTLSTATGLIGTSFFTATGSTRALYLLGKADTDTDEYDTHVVAHEFGHYLQSALSRDDSVGGSHTTGDRLDLRLAFSEGWGNAWSGMALGNPVYTDSVGSAQATGFSLNVSQAPTSNRGAFSEGSAQYLLWTTHETSALGFGSIYTALRALTTVPTFTTLYSFAEQLKLAAPSAASTVTSLWSGQQVVAQDALGTGETNNGGNAANLPVYKTYTTLGATQNFCVNSANGPDRGDNKLGRYVYIVFTTPADGSRTITATRSGGSFADPSDPDLALVKSDGSRVVARIETTPTQALTTNLPTGRHVIALEDYELNSPISGPSSDSCFNFTVN